MTTNITRSPKDTDVHKATTVINAFVPWVLVLGGSVCNVLTILGMRTSKFRSLSTSVFMTVASFNNLLGLLTVLVAHWVHLNFPNSIDRGVNGNNLCKFANFYGWGQGDLGVILMSAMTADRAYAILRPMTTVDLVNRAKIIIVVCIGVVVLKDFHFLFSSVVVASDRQDRVCDVDCNGTSFRQFYVHYWPWINITFITACLIVIAVSNTVIVNHVRKNRKGRELQVIRDIQNTKSISTSAAEVGMSDGAGDLLGEAELQSPPHPLTRTDSTMTIHGGGEYENVGKQVTRMLLAESVAFIILSLPFSVHLVVTSMVHSQHPDQEAAAGNALAFNVVFYLQFGNKCVSFLVYCLAGKRFRKAILTEVLPLRSCPKWCGGSGDSGFCMARTRRELDSDDSHRCHKLRLDADKSQAASTDATLLSIINNHSATLDAVPCSTRSANNV